jgi:hypothetical protein
MTNVVVPLVHGGTFQDLQWMPYTADSTEPYTYWMVQYV